MEFGAATATLSKKLSNGSAYDGIFATPIKFRAPNLSSRLDDYCEVFGGSEAPLGSSIPILEIPQFDERKIFDDIRRSKLDYSKVFGGFGNLDTAVAYEELFVEPKRMDTFPKEALRRANGENQSIKEDPATYLKESPLVSQEAASVDVARKINTSYHKIDQGNKKGKNGTVHIAQLHAVPAYTCLIEEVIPRADMSTPVVPDAYPSTRCSERKKESGHSTEPVASPSPDNANEHSSNSGVIGHNKSNSIHVFFDGYEVSHGSGGTSHNKVPPSEAVVGHLDSQTSDVARSVKTKCHVYERAARADSPSYSDDMVDSNSEAAASVAALRKAIEEAQERINIAKESMKRKKEGIANHKRRLNCNLKTEVKKESKVKTIRLEEIDMWRTSADMDALPQVLSEIGTTMMRARQIIPDQMGKETFVVKEVISETQQKSRSNQHKDEIVQVERKEADHKATVIMFKQADSDKKTFNDYQWNEINKNRFASEKFENFGQTIEKVDGAWDQNEGHVYSGNESHGNKEFLDETKLALGTLDHGVKYERLTADVDAKETEKEVALFHELADHERKLGEREVTIGEEKFVFKHEEAKIMVEVSREVEEHQRNLRALQETVEIEREVAQKHKESEETFEVSCELEERGLAELLEPIDNEKVLNPQGSDLKAEEIRIENWGCLEDRKKRKEAALMDMDQESECSCRREGSVNVFENIEVQKIMEEMLNHIHEEEEIQEKNTENGELDGKKRCEDAKEKEKELEVPLYLMEENERGWENNSELVEVIRVKQIGPNYEEKQTKEADKPAETSPNHDKDETEDLISVQVADRIVQNNETLDVMLEEYAHREQDDIIVSSNASFEAEEKYEEPEAVEETNDCGEKNTFETSSLTQGASDLNEATSPMQNIKEAVMFDSFSIAVDETEMKVVQKQDECSKEAEKDCNLAMLVEELIPEPVEISEEAKEAEVALNKEIDEKQCGSSYEKNFIDCEQNAEASQLPCTSDWESKTFKNQESKTSDSNLKENHQATQGVEEKKADGTSERIELEKKQPKKIDETKEREREREKEKLAVERAIREARERAFAEARERAVLERAAAEARRKNMSDGRERLGKTTGQPNEKNAMEAKLKAERAAVERATAEARARALERALSEKAASEARYKSENFAAEKSFGASRDNGTKQRFYSKSFNNGEIALDDEVAESADVFDGANGDSAQRCKARSERHQRIGERVAKALAEKNMRDLLVQKEQEERNRVAEALDADVKRWSRGKEGNLRALLSTLQYILGADSGWQPIPLTDMLSNTAVKKAYRKATLFVHPDKLQQRGASIQQKYTCEKVFDLLKEAWNRFNKEER